MNEGGSGDRPAQRDRARNAGEAVGRAGQTRRTPRRGHCAERPRDLPEPEASHARCVDEIVSKRIGSRYQSGRSPDWLKFKNPAAPYGALARRRL